MVDESRNDTTPEQPSDSGEQAKPGGEQAAKPADAKSKLAAARAAGAAKREGAPLQSDTASKLAAARAAGAAKKPGAPDTAGKLAAARAAGAAKAKSEAGEAAAGVAEKPAKPTEPASRPVPRAPMARKPGETAARAGPSRRGFLSWFGAGWAFFTGACAAALLGTARFFMPNVLAEPPTRFKVGPPSAFPPDAVSNDFKAQFGVWIVHTTYQGKDVIYALRTVCTHLGCTPNWLDTERKFKCPCHGSGFYITGINFEGPAPRPLERYGIALAPDGNLEVDKSRLFQQELGQWEDPASYVELA